MYRNHVQLINVKLIVGYLNIISVAKISIVSVIKCFKQLIKSKHKKCSNGTLAMNKIKLKSLHRKIKIKIEIQYLNNIIFV